MGVFGLVIAIYRDPTISAGETRHVDGEREESRCFSGGGASEEGVTARNELEGVGVVVRMST